MPIMRFALLGPLPDGLALAQALARLPDCSLVAVADTARPDFASEARKYTDLEDLLADPQVEVVIVAGSLNMRGEQLRRTLQSEHHAFCVHPCDTKPDRAYEVALLQEEVKKSAWPVLPVALHPAWQKLAELVREQPGGLRLLTWHGSRNDSAATFTGWTTLRGLGGEIVEVSGFADTEEVRPNDPLLVNGRFEKGGVFQLTLQPAAIPTEQRIKVAFASGEAELDGPNSEGKACLRWRDALGVNHEQRWEAHDAWTEFAQCADRMLKGEPPSLSWQDEIRALELEDALRRSVEKRRSSDLVFQEISADAGSKGTLTLIGCGMIWLILLVFMASIWVPWVRWGIVPLLLGFLALLAMKWLAGPKGK